MRIRGFYGQAKQIIQMMVKGEFKTVTTRTSGLEQPVFTGVGWKTTGKISLARQAHLLVFNDTENKFTTQ